MQFKREVISMPFLKNEMMPILERHYVEISANLDIALEPDFEKYIAIENAGTLRCYTARDGEDLVGYAVFFVTRNFHYSSSLQAVQDVIYLEKSKRGVGFGKGFIDWCDSQLRDEGVQVVYHHVKQKHNFGPMLESLSYKLVDLIYARRLDK